MKQSKMRTKICPFLSGDSADVPFILCQGDDCMAFNSRPTYEYLGEDGTAQNHMGKLKYFKREDTGKEITDLLDNYWKRHTAEYVTTYLEREVEPECWCDAMPANAPQCGFEQP